MFLIQSRYKICVKAIAIGVLCLFLVNDIAWANPQDHNSSEQTTLAAELRLKPFFEANKLGFQNIFSFYYVSSELRKFVTTRDIRDSEIVRLNRTFPDSAVEIEKDTGKNRFIETAYLKCTGREYKYAIFNFKKENTRIKAVFLKDFDIDPLKPEELLELGIKTEEDKAHFSSPGLEGVWFINLENNKAVFPAPSTEKSEIESIDTPSNLTPPSVGSTEGHVNEASMRPENVSSADKDEIKRKGGRRGNIVKPGTGRGPVLRGKQLVSALVASGLGGVVLFSTFVFFMERDCAGFLPKKPAMQTVPASIDNRTPRTGSEERVPQIVNRALAPEHGERRVVKEALPGNWDSPTTDMTVKSAGTGCTEPYRSLAVANESVVAKVAGELYGRPFQEIYVYFQERGDITAANSLIITGHGAVTGKTLVFYRKECAGKTLVSPYLYMNGVVTRAVARPLNSAGRRIPGKDISCRVIDGRLIEFDYIGRAEIEVEMSDYEGISLDYAPAGLPENEVSDFSASFAMEIIKNLRKSVSGADAAQFSALVDSNKQLSLRKKLDRIAKADWISTPIKLQAIADTMNKYCVYNAAYALMNHNGKSWGSTWQDIINTGQLIRLTCDTSSRMFALMSQRLGIRSGYMPIDPLKLRGGFLVKGGIPHAMAAVEIEGTWRQIETTRLIVEEAAPVDKGGIGVEFEGKAGAFAEGGVFDLAPINLNDAIIKLDTQRPQQSFDRASSDAAYTYMINELEENALRSPRNVDASLSGLISMAEMFEKKHMPTHDILHAAGRIAQTYPLPSFVILEKILKIESSLPAIDVAISSLRKIHDITPTLKPELIQRSTITLLLDMLKRQDVVSRCGYDLAKLLATFGSSQPNEDWDVQSIREGLETMLCGKELRSTDYYAGIALADIIRSQKPLVISSQTIPALEKAVAVNSIGADDALGEIINMRPDLVQTSMVESLEYALNNLIDPTDVYNSDDHSILIGHIAQIKPEIIRPETMRALEKNLAVLLEKACVEQEEKGIVSSSSFYIIARNVAKIASAKPECVNDSTKKLMHAAFAVCQNTATRLASTRKDTLVTFEDSFPLDTLIDLCVTNPEFIEHSTIETFKWLLHRHLSYDEEKVTKEILEAVVKTRPDLAKAAHAILKNESRWRDKEPPVIVPAPSSRDAEPAVAPVPSSRHEVARIHRENLAYTPVVPPKTILCHIVTDSILPLEQRNQLKVMLEQNMEKDNRYQEGMVFLSGANAGKPDEFIKDLQCKIQEKRRIYTDLGYTDIRFDVACPNTGLVNTILGSKLGIKEVLAFEPCKTDLNLAQAEGIMLALRALHSGDIEKLKSAFTFLTGNKLSPEESVITDIDEFIRQVSFILPAAKIEDYNKRRELNDLIATNIKQAA